MYKELKYRNITYLSALFLIFGLFLDFSDSRSQSVSNLFFGLVGLNTVVFACLWLKKKILLVGLIFYLLAFNFELLFSPVIPGSGTLTPGPFAFMFKLDVLALLFILVGLWDSYREDKYFKKKLRITIVPVLTIVIVFTILFQVFVRLYG
ncbi:hypothetical protein QQ020_07570 [Fulvivirgaceae bacterium BMA12]|uniref:Uncharacterized protein n=1 Tax=Agaribacillus aureus TaxID=3051825 RepID=A0ABT8L2H2_9BACT|nr:hypothetical protein [Fulvivirgaceae bacterium BMA12]